MRFSLGHRLLFTATLVLAAFLSLAGWALHALYQQRAEEALQDQLLGHVYALLSAAGEDDKGRMRLPDALPDPRLMRPDSGLYARVIGEDDDYQWSSPSLLGRELQPAVQVQPGEQRFLAREGQLLLHFGVAWEDLQSKPLRYQLVVAGSLGPLQAELAGFRRMLWWWLGGSALLLLLVQALLLRWGLRPLRHMAGELHDIETGRKDSLDGEYPRELHALSRNLNSLVTHGRSTQERYRNSLGDLAHSLKTPLAVLQGALDGNDPAQLRDAAREQLPHIHDIVQYQLQRAAVMGRARIARSLPLAEPLGKLVNSLQKVYADKGLECELEVADSHFRGDPGDLMEMLGNLLDNACKHARRRVRVYAREDASGLELRVEDDGEGIAEADAERLLRRGERADQRHPGQGIGLAVVAETVRVYGGDLWVARSELGGAALCLRFPPGWAGESLYD